MTNVFHFRSANQMPTFSDQYHLTGSWLRDLKKLLWLLPVAQESNWWLLRRTGMRSRRLKTEGGLLLASMRWSGPSSPTCRGKILRRLQRLYTSCYVTWYFVFVKVCKLWNEVFAICAKERRRYNSIRWHPWNNLLKTSTALCLCLASTGKGRKLMWATIQNIHSSSPPTTRRFVTVEEIWKYFNLASALWCLGVSHGRVGHQAKTCCGPWHGWYRDQVRIIKTISFSCRELVLCWFIIYCMQTIWQKGSHC